MKSLPRIGGLVLLFVGIGFFVQHIFATDIVINEFSPLSSPDWVEVYNISTESADLSLYKLQDASGNTLSLSGAILPSGFATFDWSNRLNNDGDTFSLYKNSDIVMTVTYGGQGNICIPSSGGSIAWIPDGGNTYDRLSTSTKNVTNGTSFTDPCPIPTSTPTPTSAPTPTLTSTPTPTRTPTPTPTRAQTPTNTPLPTSTKMPTPTSTPIASVSAVLGVTAYPAPASVSATETKSSTRPLIISLLLVGIGSGILSVVFIWKKRNSCILEK